MNSILPLKGRASPPLWGQAHFIPADYVFLMVRSGMDKKILMAVVVVVVLAVLGGGYFYLSATKEKPFQSQDGRVIGGSLNMN
jgi:hypothetical protein